MTPTSEGVGKSYEPVTLCEGQSPTKALVQLSVRHKRNDHLWFALFHELAHVLFHGKKEVFVEYKLRHDGGRMDEELEANNFAS